MQCFSVEIIVGSTDDTSENNNEGQISQNYDVSGLCGCIVKICLRF